MASEHKIKISADVREISAAFTKVKKLVDDTFKPRKVEVSNEDPLARGFGPQSNWPYPPGVRPNYSPHLGQTPQNQTGQFNLFGPKPNWQPARGPQDQMGLSFPGVKPHIPTPNIGGGVFNQAVGGSMMRLGGGLLGGMATAGASAVAGMALNPFPAVSRAGKMLDLMSLGYRGGSNGLRGLERGGLSTGYGVDDTRSQAAMMQRLVGNTNSLGDAQKFSRTSGFGVDEITGMMGGFRQAGVGSKDSMKMLHDMFRDAVATGFDETSARDALDVISTNTTELASSGGASPKAIADVVKSLMASSSFFSNNARAAGSAFQSVDQAFTGGSGATQALAFRALAKLNPGASPMQLIEKVGFGLGGSRGSGVEGFKGFLSQVGGLSTGRSVGAGTRLSEDQRASFSVNLKNVLGVKQTLATEIVEAFLRGDSKNLKAKMDKADEDLGQKTFDILNSPEMGIAKLTATTGEIYSILSQEFVGKWLPMMGTNLEKIYQMFAPIFENIGGITSTATPIGAAKAMYEGFDSHDLKTLNPMEAWRRGVMKQVRGTAGGYVSTPGLASAASAGIAVPGTGQIIAGRVTGHFGEQRPGHIHAGVDTAVPTGTPVPAQFGGVVDFAGKMGGYGNTVVIKNGNTKSLMAHLSEINVKKGDNVGFQDIVGKSGNSGRSTGPHLHQEMRVDNKAIDPMSNEAKAIQANIVFDSFLNKVKKEVANSPKIHSFISSLDSKKQQTN